MSSGPEETENAKLALANEFIRVEVGSTLYGTGIAGQEDRDEMGVCFEPLEYVLGLQRFQHYQLHTAGKDPETGRDRRSGPGDLDLTIYSARKFCSLALGGNPTLLQLLFVPRDHWVVETTFGHSLQELAPAFVCQSAGRKFLGYLSAQRERIDGTKGGKHTNRPELIEVHGYDTKYAMHMIRLGFQGYEFLTAGKITLPMVGESLQTCLDVRHGRVSKAEALELSYELEAKIEVALSESQLPEDPDRYLVDNWLIRNQQQWWLDEWNRTFNPPYGDINDYS